MEESVFSGAEILGKTDEGVFPFFFLTYTSKKYALMEHQFSPAPPSEVGQVRPGRQDNSSHKRRVKAFLFSPSWNQPKSAPTTYIRSFLLCSGTTALSKAYLVFFGDTYMQKYRWGNRCRSRKQ